MALGKWCPKCATTKNREQFSVARSRSDGLQGFCKACCAIAVAKWAADNKERKALTDSAWKLENKERTAGKNAAWRAANKGRIRDVNAQWVLQNADRKRAQIAAWREKNKERVAATNIAWLNANRAHKHASEARWRAANKETIARKSAKYKKENRDKLAAVWARYYAAKKNAVPVWADHKYIAMFYEMAREESCRTGRAVHVDHIVPLQGATVSGLHCEHNLQLLFADENRSKGNRLWPDMP